MPCGVGGGTHRSWLGGGGGRPRALIPGEGVREGLAWQGKAGWVPTGAGLVDGGQGLGGEACDSCQCSHMSNTPMHDVHMLKVLVWTQ